LMHSARVQRSIGIPAPYVEEGGTKSQKSDEFVPRERGNRVSSGVHARSCGDPVRRGLSFKHKRNLEYWITGSSRATTTESGCLTVKSYQSASTIPLSPANAGANHRVSCGGRIKLPTAQNLRGRGVWVPAFAGTTHQLTAIKRTAIQEDYQTGAAPRSRSLGSCCQNTQTTCPSAPPAPTRPVFEDALSLAFR